MPEWIDVFAQYGVAGLGLFVAAVAVVGVVSLKRKSPSPEQIALAVAETVRDALRETLTPWGDEIKRNTEELTNLRLAFAEIKGRMNGRGGKR